MTSMVRSGASDVGSCHLVWDIASAGCSDGRGDDLRGKEEQQRRSQSSCVRQVPSRLSVETPIFFLGCYSLIVFLSLFLSLLFIHLYSHIVQSNLHDTYDLIRSHHVYFSRPAQGYRHRTSPHHCPFHYHRDQERRASITFAFKSRIN